MSVRAATPDEEDIVFGFFEGLEKGLGGRIAAGCYVAVAERDGVPFALLVSQELLELPPELLEGAETAGLPIGTIEDGTFHLDLQGAVLAAPHTRKQAVRVTEHAARLFLYSRNILGDSVMSFDASLSPGDACIVTNPRHEAVGIGVVVGSFKGPREAVKPVHDLGSYLRDQDEGE